MHTVIKRVALAIELILLAPLVPLLIFLSMCMYPFIWVLERFGDAAWYRRQRDSMASGRPGLPDGKFIHLVGADDDDAGLLLAIREAMADSIGLSKENIYPQDRMSDLLRMQWGVGDIMLLLFRLEKVLGAKIDSESLKRFRRRPNACGEDFGEFATSAVRMLVREAGRG